MAKIKTLKDSGGNSFYPQTHIKGIVDNNGNNLEAIFSEQEKQVDSKIAEHSTVRFDRIEENEATVNSGEIDHTPSAIVYYKPGNKFVAADDMGSYWDTWDGMEAYMSNVEIRRDKVYLCGGIAYVWNGICLSDCATEYGKKLNAEINNVKLMLDTPIKDIYYSDILNLSRRISFDIVSGAKLKIRIELSESLRLEGDEMYIYLRDETAASINYIGEIKYGERFLEKELSFTKEYKNAYVLYTLSYSNGYTITTTIEQLNSIPVQISSMFSDINRIDESVSKISNSLKEWKPLEYFDKKVGFITANGGFNDDFDFISVNYYNVSGYDTLKLTSFMQSEGVYLVHFFDKNNYIGHLDVRDTAVDDFVFSVPAEATTAGINYFKDTDVSLSYLIESSSSISEKVSKIERNVLLKKNIVAFGDSITAMKDDNGKGYIDYVAEITDSTVYNAGIAGSRLSVAEECAFIKILTKASVDGEVKVKGAVREVTFTANTTDSIEDLAAKLFNAYKSLSSTLAYNLSGNEVAVRNWSGFTAPINVNNIVCETNTGVTIEVRKNKYGMFETFTSTYMAYSNLDIPNMVYGLISGDWRCQMLAAEYLASQNILGLVKKISILQELSIDDIDIVTIAGGTNNYADADWGANDSNNTAYLSGGINEIIQILLSAKPTLRVAFFTPIPRYFGNSISNWDDSMWGDNYVKNEHNGVMPALVDKITAVVKRNHIPVYDIYYSIGWNRWNFAQFFKDSDGTHPQYGLKWMGEKMAKYLL